MMIRKKMFVLASFARERSRYQSGVFTLLSHLTVVFGSVVNRKVMKS